MPPPGSAVAKEAKAASIAAERASVTVGVDRLRQSIPRAGAAFPARRLRSSGDLSRYAIGGFTNDPAAQQLAPSLPPIATGSTPPKKAPLAVPKQALPAVPKQAERQTYKTKAGWFQR